MEELVIKKCLKCGAMVKVIEDCKCGDCGIRCCGEPMKKITPNDSDGAIEKHKPTYEIDNDNIVVKVNHVMEEEHYIEYLCLLTDNTEEYVYLKPGDRAVAKFKKVTSGKVYSYCNKHGLWVTDIE